MIRYIVLAPSDFCFFPKLKEFMKGHKVSDDENVICNNSSTTELELWRNAGPSAFQLQENMSTSDKI